MTLLLIIEKLWRYKFVTLPIILLVLVGGFYQVAMTPPVYQASTSYILVSPPAAPTPDQIAQNPKLARGSNNPYTRYSDQSVIIQILSTRLGSATSRAALLKQGVDPRFILAPDVSFGFTMPVLQITGLGDTGEEAVKSTKLVGKALLAELAHMQAVENVSPTYQFTAQEIVPVAYPQLKATGKIRSLVAVMVLGGVMLFLAVSILDAIAMLRRRRSQPAHGEGAELRLAGWAPQDSAPGTAPVHPAHPATPPPPQPLRSGASAWDGPQPPQPAAVNGHGSRPAAPRRGSGRIQLAHDND
jgi:capsular polysaccharide biosynthesis protein